MSGEPPPDPQPTPDAAPLETAPEAPAPAPEPAPEPAPLLVLRDGLPPVVETLSDLEAAATALAQGTGPVAVDAERASGYRYSARAYLVQLRREGAGTFLVDPIPLPHLEPLARALEGTEWIFHAASQDLPCLAEIGLRPDRLFDTELAGRLLGYPRVGLATMVEELLGRRMRKEHSAVDWSTRPLPASWLEYAALDVEVLVELRDLLHRQLVDSDKLEWALEEFEHLRLAPSSPPRPEPWRRTSGLHRVRGRRSLAAVRALWVARDTIAAQRDVTPSRIIPDSAVVEAAVAMPRDRGALLALKGFVGRGAHRYAGAWLDALRQAVSLPDTELPDLAARSDGPPPPRAWAERDPVAAARLAAARAALAAMSAELSVPVENLVSPDAVRRVIWEPPDPADLAGVAAALRRLGARSWQVTLTAPLLVEAVRSVG
jgi:ribonuclease D